MSTPSIEELATAARVEMSMIAEGSMPAVSQFYNSVADQVRVMNPEAPDAVLGGVLLSLGYVLRASSYGKCPDVLGVVNAMSAVGEKLHSDAKTLGDVEASDARPGTPESL
jgi:hypothetical protein